MTASLFFPHTGVFAMEIWCQHNSYAFSTTGSGYAPERSALYAMDKAISWHSHSIMGVSCLQQHVVNCERVHPQKSEHMSQPLYFTYYSGHFIHPSSLINGAFIGGFWTSEKNKATGKSKQVHCQWNYRNLTEIRQKTDQVKYSLVRRAGCGLEQTLDRFLEF